MAIRKRGKNTWEITIHAGQDEKGKRVRQFHSFKGTKAMAEQKHRELQTAVDRGVPVSTNKINFAEWTNRWLLEYVTPNLRQMTKERYERAMRKHVIPEIGHIKLTNLTPRHIQSLQAKLADNGMSPAGIDLIHNIISSCLKYALRMEVIWRNPAQAVTPPRHERTEIEPPDIAGVKKVLSLAKETDPISHACLHLIAYTGIRRGEALALQWQNVDLENGTISIVRTLGRSVEKGLLFEKPKTTSGRRVIDLDDGTVSVLRAHQGHQLLNKSQLEDAYEDNDLVFANALGQPMNPMMITRTFKRLAKECGLKDHKLHSLRHFHASVTLQSGQSLLLISKRLGHAGIATTADIYGHILPGWQKEAANAFARAMEEG